MYDTEKQIATAGAYIFYNGYFLFMFGHAPDLNENELGIVRFGGHLEEKETMHKCVQREVKEETALDCHLFDNNITYNFEEKSQNYQKIEYDDKLYLSPILIIPRLDNTISVTYLAYGKGKVKPNMETQGILLLKQKDIVDICSRSLTFAEYKKKGGKFILTEKLKKLEERPGDFVLVPKIQLLFLNQLFKKEPELIKKFCNNIKKNY